MGTGYAIKEDLKVNIKDSFFEQLHEETTKIGRSPEMNIPRDLNNRVGKRENDKIIRRQRDGILNNKGEKLFDLCDQKF